MKYLILLLSVIALIQTSTVHAETSDASSYQPKGAACVIRDDSGQVLFVQNYLSDTLSLPGGFIQNGEDYRRAAERETFEETGLKVNVGNQLAINDYRVIYACQTETQHSYFYPNLSQYYYGNVVPVFNAPHYAKEIRQVFLLPLTIKVLSAYQYPDDVDLLIQWLKQTPTSNFTQQQNQTVEPNSLIQTQLSWISELQSLAQNFALIKSVLHISVWLSDTVIVFITLAIVFVTLPLKYSATMTFALVLSSYSANLLTLLFEVPRPFYVVPSLQNAVAVGYGFPSIKLAISSAMVGMLLSWLNHNGRCSKIAALMSWLVVVIFASLAMVWLGIHYPADVVAGSILGGLATVISTLLFNMNNHHNEPIIESRRLWLFMLFVCLYGVYEMIQPFYTYLWFAVLGILSSLILSQFAPSITEEELHIHWPRVLISFLGLAALIAIPPVITSPTDSAAFILLSHAFTIWLCIIWLLVASPVLANLLKRSP
ncbi:bifunctional NUDIX hydrolase/phosphatase PAP2 family protein [Vibrio sp. TRT 17S01]|uniref:bifunctional NUDIX hydrolase/phosphatase PAP2 family protein n=1 Tax=Vibrio sp. TRT 17S01 TaxID=3418505 RepID=UPI003CEB8073